MNQEMHIQQNWTRELQKPSHALEFSFEVPQPGGHECLHERNLDHKEERVGELCWHGAGCCNCKITFLHVQIKTSSEACEKCSQWQWALSSWTAP